MPIPPIFSAIQKASGTTWKEMYQVYNMGHRMEIYCTQRDVKKVVALAESFSIRAAQIGHIEKSATGKNQLTIMHGRRKLRY